MRSTDHATPTWVVFSMIGMSWLGLAVHNAAELGGTALLEPETTGPTAVLVLLAAGWFTSFRRVAEWMLLGWGWLHLVGGLLSVLPLPLWPYEPDQTLSHYAFHAQYALLQLPLLVTLTRHLHRRPHGLPRWPHRARHAFGRQGMIHDRDM
jgi:hypothetical protein